MTVEFAIDEKGLLFVQRQTLHLRVVLHTSVGARPAFRRISCHREPKSLLLGHPRRLLRENLRMLRKADSSNGEIAMHLGLVTLHVLMESGLCLAANVALAAGGIQWITTCFSTPR